MSMRLKIITLSAFLVLAGTGIRMARAHDITDVATMLEKGNPYDARISIGFRTTLTTAALNREYMGNYKGVEVVKDLIYTQTKMELDLKAEFAIFKNLAIYIRIPIVLKQQNEYNFAGGSRFPGYPGEPDCRTAHPDDPSVCNPDGVNARNSRTVQDGVAAGLSGIAYDDVNNAMVLPPGFDVGGGEAGNRTLFKGPNRSGIDQLHIGIHWLFHGFKQADDPTKPNWRIGAEFRLSVGKIMDFKRDSAGDTSCGPPLNNNWNCRPNLNDAVGRGIHEIRFYTTLSKRLWILDSFIHFYFQMPMAFRKKSFYRSKYDFSDNWGEEDESPVNKAPKIAGLRFGTEIVAWEKPQDHFKFVVTLVGIIDYVFPGRDYSEAYELLAGSPILNMNCDNPSALYQYMCTQPDNTAVRNALTYFPGLTDVQDYAVFGGQIGFDFLIYKYVKLTFNYTLVHRQEHFLTLTDAGEDTGTDPLQPDGSCAPGNACRDGRVNIPSREQNPWHRPAVDTPGHRYRIQEMMVHQIWLNLQFRF
jgi:hypothetical protein